MLAPPAIAEAGSVLLSPQVLAVGVAVGLLGVGHPVQPGADRPAPDPPRLFGILMSLEPAAAALAAVIVLRECLSSTQWLALVCVVIARVGATRTSTPPVPNPTVI